MASAINSYVISLKLCPSEVERVAVSEIRPDEMTVNCRKHKHMNTENWLSELNRRPQGHKSGPPVKVKGVYRFRANNHTMIYFSLIAWYRANRRLVLAGVTVFR